jgi:hypothetical protein
VNHYWEANIRGEDDGEACQDDRCCQCMKGVSSRERSGRRFNYFKQKRQRSNKGCSCKDDDVLEMVLGLNYGGESMDAWTVFEDVMSSGVEMLCWRCASFCRGFSWIVEQWNRKRRVAARIAETV